MYVCVCAVHCPGYFLTMISDSQFYVVDVGRAVTMECSFHADHYRLFDTPVMWRKRQLNDDLPINMLSSINEPFVATARFRVQFAAVEPRYQLPLSISGTYVIDHRVKYILYLESIRPIKTAENFEAVEWATGFSNENGLFFIAYQNLTGRGC